GVRYELIAQLRVLLRDRLDGRVVHFLRRGQSGLPFPETHLAEAPAPGRAQAPDAPVRAERAVERRELKPARVQFARQLARGVEAARVRTPVRCDAQTGVQADPDLVAQCVPARLRIARPQPRAPLGHAEDAIAIERP